MPKDDLGDRMKRQYENRYRILLPRRSYVVLRIDGKSFHSYTRGCERPYDAKLMADMDATAVALCEQIEGTRLAFVQSDEISLVLTDFESPQTEAWFDNNLAKMCSISASMVTAHFNTAGRQAQQIARKAPRLAYFDSRAFVIPDLAELANYLIWRQQDATRNSISMTAQAHFSHKELQGKSSNEMQEMLWQEKGINWNNMPVGFKRGRCVVREQVVKDVTYTDKRTGEEHTIQGVQRHLWTVAEPPIFTQNRGWLGQYIPFHPGYGPAPFMLELPPRDENGMPLA